MPEYRQREDALCEKIRELTQEINRLTTTNEDITQIQRCLETALHEFILLRRDCKEQINDKYFKQKSSR